MCVSMPSISRPLSAALLFGLLLLPCASRAQVTPPDPKLAAELAANSEAGLKALQTWYISETGLENDQLVERRQRGDDDRKLLEVE